MPTSYPNQISTIISIILRLNPNSILDIGPGFGKYGFLSREYLESWFGSGKLYQFKHRIDAVEFYPEYISPVHRFIYDHIYVGSIETQLSNLNNRYDLMLLIDVIEHFTLKDGIQLIRGLLDRADNIIISTPKRFIPQSEIYGNVKETHCSLWRRNHFHSIGRGLFFYDDENIIWFIGKQMDLIHAYHRHCFLKRYFPMSYNVFKWMQFHIFSHSYRPFRQ